jgi:ATP-dependent 26S proteasome regulatory subunit
VRERLDDKHPTGATTTLRSCPPLIASWCETKQLSILAIADGVVRAQGRKIIFTTNLPNMRDIDEALLRPGRCYASVSTRQLDRADAAKLLARIVPDASIVVSLLDALFASVRTVSVADLYRACARA